MGFPSVTVLNRVAIIALPRFLFAVMVLSLALGCNAKPEGKSKKASEIFGNPEYMAISYGGYRATTRDEQPTIAALKEDMLLLHAMGVRLLRTYNVHLMHASNVLQAIKQLKSERPDFEMYVMLGVWINCKNAWTDQPDHSQESEDNAGEIDRAVALTSTYPDIVKSIAVGNEAMVKWATSYYVQPGIILKWVNHLQSLKEEGTLSKDLWITSSDDFASWGGGGEEYHTPELEQLFAAVDFVSMHTYPYHNSHYNPDFWRVPESHEAISEIEKVDAAMVRAKEFAQHQYGAVKAYMKSIGVDKPVHIGETGWSTISDGYYGTEGSKAADEYKQALYYQYMRGWTNASGISCFYFEAFDEQWKDAKNPVGSENHFGLINLKNEAKYALWHLVDGNTFDGLTRDGKPITKTYNGNIENLLNDVLAPPPFEKSVSHAE